MQRPKRNSVISNPTRKINRRFVTRREFDESSSDGDPIPTLKGPNASDSYYYSDSETGSPVHVHAEKFVPKPPPVTKNARAWRFRRRQEDPTPQNEPETVAKQKQSDPPEPPSEEEQEAQEIVKQEQTEEAADATESEEKRTGNTIHNLLVDMAANRVSYHLESESTFKLTGFTYSFSLTRGSEHLMSLKFKSSAKEVPLECESFKGVILLNRDGNQYCLRRESELGRDVCTVRYNKSKSTPSTRVCRVYLLERDSSLPYVLRSCSASDDRFGPRHVLPSVKNCILVDAEKQEKMAVMKVGKNTLCIDAVSEIPPHIVFLVGVSACL